MASQGRPLKRTGSGNQSVTRVGYAVAFRNRYLRFFPAAKDGRHWLATGWPLAGHWLATGWPLAGYWLASYPGRDILGRRIYLHYRGVSILRSWVLDLFMYNPEYILRPPE